MEDINKDIKELEESIKEAYRCYDYGLDYNPLSKGIAEIIEHLIKEYKEKDKDNNDLRRLYRRTAIKLKENEKENQKLKTELKKKDNIIYELEDIFYNYQLCEYELTDCTYRKCEYIADDENPPCKECIKQYFERKVENGN